MRGRPPFWTADRLAILQAWQQQGVTYKAMATRMSNITGKDITKAGIAEALSNARQRAAADWRRKPKNKDHGYIL